MAAPTKCVECKYCTLATRRSGSLYECHLHQPEHVDDHHTGGKGWHEWRFPKVDPEGAPCGDAQ